MSTHSPEGALNDALVGTHTSLGTSASHWSGALILYERHHDPPIVVYYLSDLALSRELRELHDLSAGKPWI
jgi:hypothetical protein